MATATQIEAVRDWVGSTPDDDAITAQIDRFPGDAQAPERAALAILLRRQADDSFDSFEVKDDVAWSRATWAKELSNRIAQLRARLGGGSGNVAGAPTVSLGTVAGTANAR